MLTGVNGVQPVGACRCGWPVPGHSATLDPDERTHRKGVDMLGQAGISVSVGLMESQARQAMAGFLRGLKTIDRT